MNFIKKALRKYKADLLFTNTYGLVQEIKTEDAYEDFYQEKNLFHFSDYSKDSKFFDPFNKKVGKTKDEIK